MEKHIMGYEDTKRPVPAPRSALHQQKPEKNTAGQLQESHSQFFQSTAPGNWTQQPRKQMAPGLWDMQHLNEALPPPYHSIFSEHAGLSAGYQMGFDCTDGGDPGSERENLYENAAAPPECTRTEGGNPLEFMFSEKVKFTQSLTKASVSHEGTRRPVPVPRSAATQHMSEAHMAGQWQDSHTQAQTRFWMGQALRRVEECTEVSNWEFRAFMNTGDNLKKGLQRFVLDLSNCAGTLQIHIQELEEVACKLDKTHKGVKIARITGGTTGAVGGAAAVAGILLAPATMGASLAITAVGVGVAAAGGVTGASAAITKKVNKKQVRKKVETILRDYDSKMKIIETHLDVVNTEIINLRKHELTSMRRVNAEAAKIVRLAEVAGGTSTTLAAINRCSGVIRSFALGMDFYFTDQDSQKLKRESKTKFAKMIREVAEQNQAGLNELIDIRDKLQSEGL